MTWASCRNKNVTYYDLFLRHTSFIKIGRSVGDEIMIMFLLRQIYFPRQRNENETFLSEDDPTPEALQEDSSSKREKAEDALAGFNEQVGWSRQQ